MKIIPFPSRKRLSATAVIFADFQVESIMGDRQYGITEAEACLRNARRLLEHARSLDLPIAHFRQGRKETDFSAVPPFKWIESFRPQTNEMVYERSRPSCYSNSGFCSFLGETGRPVLVMAGLAGERAGLATAIEGYHRDHRIVFVRDCSATPALGALSETESHDVLCRIISHYAELTTLDQMLRQLSRIRGRGSSAL